MDPQSAALVAASMINASRMLMEAVELWQAGKMTDAELIEANQRMRAKLSGAREGLDKLLGE